MSTCSSCKCDLSESNSLGCGHIICKDCVHSVVEDGIANGTAVEINCPILSCDYQLQPNEIQSSISEELFTSYLDSCFKGFIEKESDLIPCPNEECSSLMEFVDIDNHELKLLQNNEITQKGEDGRNLSRIAWIHFNQFRIRCRDCQQDFCAHCNIIPYHLGMDCEQYKEYLKAKKCRFCQTKLKSGQLAPPSSYPALQNCCKSEECIAIREITCEKTLNCSHFCGGGRGETKCLPCLEEDCLLHIDEENNKPSQNKHDFCPICWVNETKN